MRALANIVRNAAQAAQKRVNVRAHGERGFAVVTVDDDGPGVYPDERERLFRRFGRGKNTGYAGSGLGLPIAAAIADAARGSIEVSSTSSGGARFTVRLPLSG